MATVNAELHKKIEEVGRTNNDLSNLLASTGIGTLFMDHQLRVQRFTPATSRVISLIQTDVGRPVSDIVARFRGYDRLAHDVREVPDTLIPKETMVQHQDGSWYQLRIQPYRTLENVIEGAVLTFVDVTQQKLLQTALQESAANLALLFELLEVANMRAVQEQRAVHHVATGVMKADGTVVWTDMSAVPMALPGWQVVVVTFDLSASEPA